MGEKPTQEDEGFEGTSGVPVASGAKVAAGRLFDAGVAEPTEPSEATKLKSASGDFELS